MIISFGVLTMSSSDLDMILVSNRLELLLFSAKLGQLNMN